LIRQPILSRSGRDPSPCKCKSVGKTITCQFAFAWTQSSVSIPPLATVNRNHHGKVCMYERRRQAAPRRPIREMGNPSNRCLRKARRRVGGAADRRASDASVGSLVAKSVLVVLRRVWPAYLRRDARRYPGHDNITHLRMAPALVINPLPTIHHLNACAVDLPISFENSVAAESSCFATHAQTRSPR
jgi:hypothetical protein